MHATLTASRTPTAGSSTAVDVRVAACLAVLCLGMHLVALATAATGMLAMAVPMLVLSATCALCGVRAWRRAAPEDASMLLAGGAVMVGVHVVLALVLQPGHQTAVTEHLAMAHGMHQHGSAHGWPMTAAAAIAALQTVVAAIARVRSRRQA